MGNARINYIEIIKYLNKQFIEVLEYTKDKVTIDDKEVYNELKTINGIFIADEQFFLKFDKYNNNNIYIAVRFGSATVNFASSVLSLSLRIISTENKIKPTQLILSEFVTRFNLQHLDAEETMSQVWYTPTVSSNFNNLYKGFRSLFSMNGIVVVGQHTVDLGMITYITDGEPQGEEEVAVMSFSEGYQATNNPQPFGNTDGMAVSEVDYGTNAITITTYLLDSQLVADCMHARGYEATETEHLSTKKKWDDFCFIIKYTNGYGNQNNPQMQKFKFINYRIEKKIGDIPSFIVSFSY